MEQKIKSMRLPVDLIEKLNKQSIAEHRSFSQMVKVILSEHFLGDEEYEEKRAKKNAPQRRLINNSTR